MLYEHYFGFALKIVFRYIYRYDKAKDLVNDGFVKLFTTIDRFRIPDSNIECEKMLPAYLKRIMINTAIDDLRREKMSPEIGGIPDYIWDENNCSQASDSRLLYKELILIIKNLPPQYRSVFNLYIIDGYNHLEIADMLQIPVGTSKSALSRAKALLQKNIKQLEDANICEM